MLLPRFSLRLLLLVTTLSGVFFLVVSLALAGRTWAIAVTAAISAILTLFAVHALVFSLAWAMTLLWRALVRRPTRGSPFAASSPPPQLIPPTDPE